MSRLHAWKEKLKTVLLVGWILLAGPLLATTLIIGAIYIFRPPAPAPAPVVKSPARHCTDLVAQSIADGTIEPHESAQLFQACVQTAQEPTP